MSNAIKAIVCDFDGTFSTLRCGWEAVMKRMMLKYLPDEAWIDEFIGETTGVPVRPARCCCWLHP